jgi:hypothetical protein
MSNSEVVADPRADYTRHLESRRQWLGVAVRQHIMYGNWRLAALVAAVLATYFAFGRGLFSGWWLLALAAAYFWIGGRLERAIHDRARFGRGVAFYERALARLDGRWVGTGAETGDRFLDDEHLYARDLDLFGPASLFELLTCARTRMGEATLAAWLKTPSAPAVVQERREAIVELAPRTDLREDLAVLGEDARTVVRAETLAAWSEGPARLSRSALPIWAWPLTAAGAIALVGIIVWLAAALGALALDERTMAILRLYIVTMFAICGGVTWRVRQRAEAIFHDADTAARDLGLLAGVLRRIEAERFAAPRLASLRAALDSEGEPPSRRIARLHTLMGYVDSRDHVFIRLLGPLVLWDIHLVYAIERWRAICRAAVRRWLDAAGEIEALSSLAGYRYEHPDDVFPEFIAGPPSFDAAGVAHPLLVGTVAVPNDVSLTGDLRVLVVSGSNMSGKSTLLRTVGINAVLAQAGAPVRARHLRMTPLEIGTSIHVHDSLLAGVSRFYAEITRLGAIMRRAADAPPLLFLIDELLHGTNSHDRRIGAEAIVRGLVDRGAIGLVTTHDLALAHVAESLGTRGANVHFADDLVAGRMHFDYRLRPGIVEKSNALELMRSVGLDV